VAKRLPPILKFLIRPVFLEYSNCKSPSGRISILNKAFR
jgi:hypothetical protein